MKGIKERNETINPIKKEMVKKMLYLILLWSGYPKCISNMLEIRQYAILVVQNICYWNHALG